MRGVRGGDAHQSRAASQPAGDPLRQVRCLWKLIGAGDSQLLATYGGFERVSKVTVSLASPVPAAHARFSMQLMRGSSCHPGLATGYPAARGSPRCRRMRMAPAPWRRRWWTTPTAPRSCTTAPGACCCADAFTRRHPTRLQAQCTRQLQCCVPAACQGGLICSAFPCFS